MKLKTTILLIACLSLASCASTEEVDPIESAIMRDAFDLAPVQSTEGDVSDRLSRIETALAKLNPNIRP